MAIGSPQWMYNSGEAYEIDQSLRFNDDDSAYLSWTPSSAGNRKTWTWSAWVKRGNNTTQRMFHAYSSGNRSEWVFTGDTARFSIGGSSTYNITTNQVFRDPSAWYHILWSVDTSQSTESDRVNIYVNGEKLTSFSAEAYPTLNYESEINSATQHEISSYDGSGHFYDGYLAEINFIDGQQLTPADFGETGDYGEWKPKEYSGTYGTNGFYLPFKQDYTVEGFSTVTYKGNGGTQYIGGTGFKPDFTWQKRRDGIDSHVLTDSIRGTDKSLYSDRTDAEASPNPVSISAFNSDGFTLGANGKTNGSGETVVAWNWDMGADTPTGFSAVTYTGNNSARDVSGFGFQPDLVWFKNRGDAASSNTGNIEVLDSVRGNKQLLRTNTTGAEIGEAAAWGFDRFTKDGVKFLNGGYYEDVNKNNKNYVAWGWDMGGTTATNTSGSENSTVRANPTYGQSIVSYEGNEVAGTTYGHGLSSAPELIIVKNRSRTSDWKVYYGDNTKALALNTTGTPDDQTYYWNDTSPTSSVFTTGGGTDTNGNNENLVAYCFHSVSGYSKIGSYTGDGTANGSKTITTGFRPAFVMIKRTDASVDWKMFDNARNPLNPVDKILEPNTGGAEGDYDTINFTDTGTGFNLTDNGGAINTSSGNYIYMAFAGGMDSISDYNTDGSIDSRVKANTTYGQSIVSYTGNSSTNQTVGHGLSSTPDIVIIKNRDDASAYWSVINPRRVSAADPNILYLNDAMAEADSTNIMGDNLPTATTVGVDDYDGTNKNGNNFIMYCWHSVTGYSSIGSYTGNGSNTGTVVNCGFAPAFLMVKKSSGIANWYIYDNAREPEAEKGKALLANSSNAEGGDYERLKFTSTGFQLTHTDADLNGDGQTYVYMAFADTREYAYWLDQSGNNNDWTSNNLTESDISVDSPSNNFATWNPVSGNSSYVKTEGNLGIAYGGAGWLGTLESTLGMTSGKWYWEVNILIGNPSSSERVMLGIANTEHHSFGSSHIGNTAGSYSLYNLNGQWFSGTSSSSGSYGTYTNGDIMQFAYNADTGTLWIGKNNTWLNSATASEIQAGTTTNSFVTGLTGTWLAGLTVRDNSSVIANFGQDSSFAGNKVAQGNQDGNDIGDFYYTPPTGFLALCTKNLPDVAVTPSEHFNTVLYSGNGGASSSQEISTVGFQPDFVWVKPRNSTNGHHVFDSVRTFGSAKSLSTNSAQAEGAHDASYGYIGSTDADGFTANGGTSGAQYTNETGKNYVAWNWKANGSGSSNTNGSITSTVSANTDAGFSIVTYTGTGSTATVGHGLSKAPDMMIIKTRGVADNWLVGANAGSMDYTDGLYLDSTLAKLDSDTFFNDTTPTSSVFTVKSHSTCNTNNGTYVAYCFHSVDGYSKVGTYTGNGNADGTFVYTGFRPAFVMVKRTDATEGWAMVDNERVGYNPDTRFLYPNESSAEETLSGRFDIVSNGFKLRNSWTKINASSGTYIYIAFAETPFKNSNGR
jgi:hypothetical protein